MNRRQFAMIAGTAPLLSVGMIEPLRSKKIAKRLLHNVYFWLHNADDADKLIEGLTTLTKCKDVLSYHIGKPSGSSRDVVDGSYHISWCITFKSKEAEAAYQIDPIHTKFVEGYKHLWTKVVVYDSVDA